MHYPKPRPRKCPPKPTHPLLIEALAKRGREWGANNPEPLILVEDNGFEPLYPHLNTAPTTRKDPAE